MTAGFANAEKTMVSRNDEFVPDLSFYRAKSPALPANPGILTLTVGDVTVRLTGLRGSNVATLRKRYGIFCHDDGRATDLEIRVGEAGRDQFLRVQGTTEYYRIDTRWEAETMTACSYEWAGWIDFSRREGGLLLADIALETPRAFDRGLENFLRVAYSHLIIQRGGFLLHSAGLVRNGKAHLFFGPSGSGKTTVTSLTPEAHILSDDLTMVVRDGFGEYRACSVPFRGLFAPEATSDATWPIAGFYRLIQASTDRLEPVFGARAVGELVGSLPFVTDRPEIANEVIDAVAFAAAKVPIFRLHFKKDRTFWQTIDAGDPGVDGFSAHKGINP